MTDEEIKTVADKILMRLLNSEEPWLDIIVQELSAVLKED